MTTVYGLIIFEWLDVFTYLFKSNNIREEFIEQGNYESYRMFQYKIEEEYSWIDYTYCVDKNI